MGQSWKKKKKRNKKSQDVFFLSLQETKSQSEICDLVAKWFTASFVFLRFGTSAIEPLPPPPSFFCCSKLAAITDGWQHFIFPQTSGRAGEKKQFESRLSRASSHPGWDPGRRERGFGMKAALAAIPPPPGSPEGAFPGSSKGREEPRSRRYSCRISHLWLCSALRPLVRRKYNQQAWKYKCGWSRCNYSCWGSVVFG